MKINWKLRLKNRATLAALIASAVSLAYILLGIFGIMPSVTESQVMDLAAAVLNALTLMGVLIDPTTEGLEDSERALGYDAPACRGKTAKAE